MRDHDDGRLGCPPGSKRSPEVDRDDDE